MTSPPSPVNRQHLCSHESVQLPTPTLTEQFASAFPMLPGDLELKSSLRRSRVSWLAIDEMFAPEWATYCRCFPAQPPLSAVQRCNRRKCAYLLRDLATPADLPPHSALFSLQVLEFAHRWSERQDNNFHIFDVLSQYIFVKMNPAPAQGPQQTARPLADELVTHTPAARIEVFEQRCGANSNSSCRDARSFRWHPQRACARSR